MTFQLDTSGVVSGGYKGAPFNCVIGIRWDDLSPFTQGYVEAMFVALAECPGVSHGGHRFPAMTMQKGVVQPCERCRVPIDGREGRNAPVLAFSDLAPETLARIIADCEAWRDEYSDHTRVASGHRPDMGREFWRIRQSGNRSTFPPLTVQLGDDGKVRFV